VLIKKAKIGAGTIDALKAELCLKDKTYLAEPKTI